MNNPPTAEAASLAAAADGIADRAKTPIPDLWLMSYQLSVPAHLTDTEVRKRCYRFHQVAMSLFGEPLTEYGRAEKHLLWRLDRVGAGWRILMQSIVPPTAEAGMLPHVEVKPVTGLFDRLGLHVTVDYCIELSAHRRKWDSHDRATRRRKDILLTTEQNVERWVERLGPAAGLRINTGSLQYQRRHRIPNSPKTSQPASMPGDFIAGTAKITDLTLLREAVRNGVGGMKPFGCGLLSVLPRQAPDAAGEAEGNSVE